MAGNQNHFERHGIEHLSPSSLRLFNDCPAVWVGKYMLRAEDEGGPGMWRGLAVEAGVDQLLFGQDGAAAQRAMRTRWDALAMGQIDPDVAKEQDALDDFLVQAGVAFAGFNEPLHRQSKMTLELPGIPVPLVGFCDWVWTDRGDDLKTSWKMPNNNRPSPAHTQQAACYSLYWGVPWSLTYVSPRRWTRYEVTPGMAAEAYDQVIETAHAIASFLAHTRDGVDALSMISPDYTSYYFKPAMAEAVRNAKAVRVLTP